MQPQTYEHYFSDPKERFYFMEWKKNYYLHGPGFREFYQLLGKEKQSYPARIVYYSSCKRTLAYIHFLML